MMNIIEKLGITNGPWETYNDVRHNAPFSVIIGKDGCGLSVNIENKKNSRLIASAPEMLEALIMMGMENTSYQKRHDKCREIAEKATGKTWKEIKELL